MGGYNLWADTILVLLLASTKNYLYGTIVVLYMLILATPETRVI